jgi:hypothetical protein
MAESRAVEMCFGSPYFPRGPVGSVLYLFFSQCQGGMRFLHSTNYQVVATFLITGAFPESPEKACDPTCDLRCRKVTSTDSDFDLKELAALYARCSVFVNTSCVFRKHQNAFIIFILSCYPVNLHRSTDAVGVSQLRSPLTPSLRHQQATNRLRIPLRYDQLSFSPAPSGHVHDMETEGTHLSRLALFKSRLLRDTRQRDISHLRHLTSPVPRPCTCPL